MTIEALGELGDARAFDHLVEALQDGDAAVRIGAVRGLGRLGDPRAIPILMRQRAEDEGWDDAGSVRFFATGVITRLLLRA